MLIAINPEDGMCLVTFYMPQGLGYDPSFLKGRVLLSCQDGVPCRDGVVTAGEAVRYILENSRRQAIFIARLTENTRRRNDDDPYWYASEVKLYESPVQIMLQLAASQLDLALKQMG
jgi:hypothetical protein